MVKNGQKLKKGSFFLIKTLTREMAPNDMIQETQKKNWNKWRRGGNRKKTLFFWRFFWKSWKFLSEKSGWWKKEITKMSLFYTFFRNFAEPDFSLEWANRREKMSHFCDFLTYQKKNVITLTISNQFWIKKIAPGSSRRDLSN